jgi:hypothetical protein
MLLLYSWIGKKLGKNTLSKRVKPSKNAVFTSKMDDDV